MPNGNKPKISIVLPIYNQSHLISNAVNSILNQTFKDWELIIVNDGSNEDHYLNLLMILGKFNDSRVKMLNVEHQGLVTARNIGNKEAVADIIAIQDADDLSMPDRLEKCIKELSKADVVYHGAYINMWDQKFNCISRSYLPAPKFSKFALLESQNIPGWLIFKKTVWQKKPFRLETQFMSDWMTCLDWAWSGFKFKGIDEGLYEYVRHENSASIIYEKDGRREESRMKIAEIMLKEYGQKTT